MLSAYVTAAIARLVLGGGLAWAAGSSGYITNALIAVAVGIASVPASIGYAAAMHETRTESIVDAVGPPA